MKLPKVRRQTKKAERAMSKAEAAAFLKAAREDRYYALWAVLLEGGLRPGEALGLKWGDVNLDEGRVYVRRALSRRGLPTIAIVGTTRRSTAGTDAERVWPPSLKGAMNIGERSHGGWWIPRRPELAAWWFCFVFATPFGRPLEQGNLRSRNFQSILQAAQLGAWEGEGKSRTFKPAYPVYDLRHTCATLLLLADENPKVVSERLGHASVSLTLDTYSHVLPSMQEASAAKLDAMFD